MRIFVTGSEGFIGSRFCEKARQAGHFVIGFDVKVGEDLVDRDVFDRRVQVSHPEVIVHLAGETSTRGSMRRPMGTFRNNVVATANVVDVAAFHDTPVILTSSVKAREGMTPYGASKRMAELWAQEYVEAFRAAIVINRPGTVYGPGQEGSAESGWIAWFLEAKAKGLPVVIDGDGLQVRDLLYVDDYVRLLLLQCDSPATYSREIWDVGGGEENAVTVIGMANHLGLKYTLGPARYGDSRRYVALNGLPGWGPTTSWQSTGMFG